MFRTAFLVSASTGVVLALSACASSGSSTTAQSAATQHTAGVAFANCVRAHGVPSFPDPTSDSGGGLRIQQTKTAGSGASMTVNGVPVSAPAFRAAQTACQKYLPAPRPVTAQQLVSIRQSALKMAACMRAHGVPNFPDPSVNTGPGGGVSVRITGAGGGIDPSSPAFQSAQKECGPLFKKPGGP